MFRLDFEGRSEVIYPNHESGSSRHSNSSTPTGRSAYISFGSCPTIASLGAPEELPTALAFGMFSSMRDVRRSSPCWATGQIEQQATPTGRGGSRENSRQDAHRSIHEVALVLKGLTYLSRKKSLPSAKSGLC